MTIAPAVLSEMLNLAMEARANAYAPYSKFQVGASILTTNNKIFAGTNVENASYGLTICAERAAVFAAMTAGENRIKAVLIIAPDAATPCGACRQVLAEFAEPDCAVYLASSQSKQITGHYLLKDLLPLAFKL